MQLMRSIARLALYFDSSCRSRKFEDNGRTKMFPKTKTLVITVWLAAVHIMVLFGSATPARADSFTIPSDLAPGSTYYLAFVTAGTTTTASSNIDDYDAFVAAQANLNPALAALGTTWKVIGSTPRVDAAAHIGVTGPVYLLSGVRIATDSADLFDGTIGHHCKQTNLAPRSNLASY
jgi:hypothetical protein